MSQGLTSLIGHTAPILTLSDAAQDIYDGVRDLPVISPHGHCDPSWFAENASFRNPTELLILPDLRIMRQLYSQGVTLEDLGLHLPQDERNPRAIFRVFAQHFHKFRGTPTDMWFATTLARVFGISATLNAENADEVYDKIDAELKSSRMRPQSLMETFNIELLATTDYALDTLEHHKSARKQKLRGKLIPTFCPDSLLDPRHPRFKTDLARLSEVTDQDTSTFDGYLEALLTRRAYFMANGGTATDHTVQELVTNHLTEKRAATLYAKARAGTLTPKEQQSFYGHMLIEMAQMSAEDGLVMQIHAGVRKDTNKEFAEKCGLRHVSDMPIAINWIDGLNALLNRVGNARDMNIILFGLDEAAYARELAPLAGHWPALKLGSPWWFHDSANGIARYLDTVVESAGYWNLAGFNDDTKSLLSVPSRHDMWRRGVSVHLAQQRARGILGRSDVDEIARLLCRDLTVEAYKLGSVV